MFTYMNDSVHCRSIQNSSTTIRKLIGIQPLIESYEACLIILATGVLAFLIAWLFSFIRRHVYMDDDQVDTAFDAGGNVNAGLTSTTIVSQWTWAATLLQSSTVAAKYGISGSFWYAAGATIQILLFSMLSVQLKTRAPGAKTFLQVIKARFGSRTHIVFCFFALATNVIVTAMLMLGGSAVITALVKYISVEYATTLIAAIIGGYTLTGGLGATFYVCYFNTAILYILLVVLMFKVYEDKGDSLNPLGQVSAVFDFVTCARAPDGNEGNSYLTMVSSDGLMFGLINIVGNFGTVFVDQSYWQSAVAAKPKQGVMGFLLGGLAWFAIPFSLSTAMGLAYIALSAEQGEEMLNALQVDSGLVPPAVAYRLLGKSGAIIIIVMVLMAVTSTGSAEVMAVTSIVVYDIYAVYLKPYRHTTDTNSCILCGKGRGRMANPRDKCACISMTFCAKCHQDTKNRTDSRRAIKPDYKCSVHGPYRVYNDYLSRLSNWTLVWITMSIIPLTIILYMIKASLGWVYLFMGILVGSAVIPIALAMFWERLTGVAMMAGSVCGAVLGLSVWMGMASTYEGGLGDWWKNTGREIPMLSGNLVAILGGGSITMLVTLVGNRHYDVSMGEEIWENTRDIDNPLTPWKEKYQKELELSGSHRLDNRPSLQDVQLAFRRAHLMAHSLSPIFSAVLVLLWPALMVTVGVMTYNQFSAWVKLSEAWVFMAMLVMIVLPLVNESWDIWSTLVNRNKIKDICDPEAEIYFNEDEDARKLSITKTAGNKRHPGKLPKKMPNSIEEDPHENGDTMYVISSVKTQDHLGDQRTLIDSPPPTTTRDLLVMRSSDHEHKSGTADAPTVVPSALTFSTETLAQPNSSASYDAEQVSRRNARNLSENSQNQTAASFGSSRDLARSQPKIVDRKMMYAKQDVGDSRLPGNLPDADGFSDLLPGDVSHQAASDTRSKESPTPEFTDSEEPLF